MRQISNGEIFRYAANEEYFFNRMIFVRFNLLYSSYNGPSLTIDMDN